MDFPLSKHVAQNENMGGSRSDPRTVPTQEGGMPIEPDKAMVAATESDTTSVHRPSETRPTALKKREGPQLHLDEQAGWQINVPYIRSGEKRTATSYDRDYSPLQESQTSPYPQEETIPPGSITDTANYKQIPLRGPPLAKKKLNRVPELRGFTVVENFSRTAQAVISETARAKKPLEELIGEAPAGITEDEATKRTDSHYLLPSRKDIVPAVELFDNRIVYGPRAVMHADVLSGMAQLEADKYLDPERAWSDAFDIVERDVKSHGFYNPETKIYWRRKASSKRYAKITRVEIELSPQIPFTTLWSFLEENYPLSFLIEQEGNKAVVYTDDSGIPKLKTYVSNFYELEGPEKLFRQGQATTPTSEDLRYRVLHSKEYAMQKVGADHFSSSQQAFDDGLAFIFGNGAEIVFRFRTSDKHGAINSVLVGTGMHGKHLYDIVYDWLREHGYFIEPDYGYSGAGVTRRFHVLDRQLQKHGDNAHWDPGFQVIYEAWLREANRKGLGAVEAQQIQEGMSVIKEAEQQWPTMTVQEKSQLLQGLARMFARVQTLAIISQLEQSGAAIMKVSLVKNNLVFYMSDGKMYTYSPQKIATIFYQNPQNAYEIIKEVAPEKAS